MTNVKVNFSSSERGNLTHEQLREMLAALAHEQWSGWMQSMLLLLLFAEDRDALIARWSHRKDSPYDQLTDEEKAKARVDADRTLKLLEETGVWSGPGTIMHFTTPMYIADGLSQPIIITGPSDYPKLASLGEDPQICICPNTAIHTPCPVHEPAKWELFWGRKLPGKEGDR